MCQQNFFQLSIFFENEKINTRIYFRNISFYKFQDTHINIYFMIKEEIIKKRDITIVIHFHVISSLNDVIVFDYHYCAFVSKDISFSCDTNKLLTKQRFSSKSACN